MHPSLVALKNARRDIGAAADALVLRGSRRPYGPEHERDVTMCGKQLGKKAAPVLQAVHQIANQLGAPGEPTVSAVKTTSKCILDLVTAAKKITDGGNVNELIAALHAAQRELWNSLDVVEREALSINHLMFEVAPVQQ